MPPNPRVKSAFMAMKALGISEEQVKPVLKKLLKLYDKNWELIEEENYRVLLDAIFDAEDSQVKEQKRKSNSDEEEEEAQTFELQRPLKRLRRKDQENQAIASPSDSNQRLGGAPLLQPKVETEVDPQPLRIQKNERNRGKKVLVINENINQSRPCSNETHQLSSVTRTDSPQLHPRDKGKGPISQITAKERNPSHELHIRSQIDLPCQNLALIIPKDEPLTDDMPLNETPLAVIHAEPSDKRFASVEKEKIYGETCAIAAVSSHENGECRGASVRASSSEKHNCNLGNGPTESAFDLEIASSPLGEVKITLSCNSSLRRSDFHMPCLDAVLKLMEEKSLQPYKTADPNFSITKLMSDMCQCFLELGTKSTESGERPIDTVPTPGDLHNDEGDKETLPFAASDHCSVFIQACEEATGDVFAESIEGKNVQFENAVLENSVPVDAVNMQINENIFMQFTSSNGCNDLVHARETAANECAENVEGVESVESEIAVLRNSVMRDDSTFGSDRGNSHMPCSGSDHCNAQGKKLLEPESSVCGIIVSPHCELTHEDARYVCSGNDISNGEEMVNIAWVNEINNQSPPSFRYIPQSLVFCSAAVTVTLAEIRDEHCCASCFDDCVSSGVPCACSCANGGRFAYTIKGLLKEEFLEESVAMTCEPQKRCRFFCQDCPLERSENDVSETCKGHEKRSFIKECWRKCWCSRRCNNRVVQRGISCSLQVFMTAEGKGWGLRTLEDLPKGAFVCEYVGEILTCKEVHDRNMHKGKAGTCDYQVFLDSGWDTASPKDDEALCLDATCYGNIARFINHRCFDANLIPIPVEVEMPKRHYYHLAFFTTREVKALEELTWDYGVDFDKDSKSVKAFQCLCGSQFCRNLKCSNEVTTAT